MLCNRPKSPEVHKNNGTAAVNGNSTSSLLKSSITSAKELLTSAKELLISEPVPPVRKSPSPLPRAGKVF